MDSVDEPNTAPAVCEQLNCSSRSLCQKKYKSDKCSTRTLFSTRSNDKRIHLFIHSTMFVGSLWLLRVASTPWLLSIVDIGSHSPNRYLVRTKPFTSRTADSFHWYGVLHFVEEFVTALFALRTCVATKEHIDDALESLSVFAIQDFLYKACGASEGSKQPGSTVFSGAN